MRKLYPILAAAFIALSAAATPVEQVARPATHPSKAIAQQAVSKARPQGKQRRAASAKRAVPAPPEAFAPVTELPEGVTPTIYSLQGNMYRLIWGVIPVEGNLDGFMANVAIDGDDIYIGPMISSSAASYDHSYSYMVGKIADGVATFQFPQALGYMTQQGYEYQDWAALFTREQYVEDDYSWEEMVICEDQTLKFTINENGFIEADDANAGKYLGDCEYVPEEYAEEDYPAGYYFWGESEELVSLRPFTGTTAVIPAEVTLEQYNVILGFEGYKIFVGQSGDDIYIKGLCQSCPDGVMAGKVQDGKATFAPDQFQGIDPAYMTTIYVVPGKIEQLYDEEWEEYYDDVVQAEGDLTFTIDSEAGTLTPDQVITFSVTGTDFTLFDYIEECTIVKPNGAEVTVPTPTVDYFFPHEEFDGVMEPAQLYFTISQIYDEVNLLDVDKLFFTLYLDGEPFSFEPDEYPGIEESTTELPYGFDNGWDIMADAGSQALCIYPEGWQTLGIQGIYRDGESVAKSEIVTINYSDYLEDSIPELSTINSKLSTIYDLQGHRIQKITTPGLYIINGKKILR